MVKNLPANAGDTGSIPGSGRSAGEGIGYPLQYSGLENPMDCRVCGVAKSDTTEGLSLHFRHLYPSFLAQLSYNFKRTVVFFFSPMKMIHCRNAADHFGCPVPIESDTA